MTISGSGTAIQRIVKSQASRFGVSAVVDMAAWPVALSPPDDHYDDNGCSAASMQKRDGEP